MRTRAAARRDRTPRPVVIGQRTERTLVAGVALKRIALVLGETAVLGVAIWHLVEGRWAADPSLAAGTFLADDEYQ